MTAKSQIILTTIALADAFGWALTGFEVWRYALNEEGKPQQDGLPTLGETIAILDEMVADGTLSERDGYYAFPGREDLIRERLWRSQLIGQKRRKAMRWANWMIRLPWVLGVFAYGSLATGHTSAESDLDVYVVLRDGRIFSGRLLVSLFLEIFGVRRTAKKVQDQICLNHFVIEGALEFREEFRSPFSAWLWSRMFPLAVDNEQLVEAFYQANAWVTHFFPNLGRSREVDQEGLSREEAQTKGGTRFGDALEERLGRVQLRRIQRHPLTREGRGRIVAGPEEMIFHPGLPEKEVLERFHQRKTMSIEKK